MTFNQAHRVRVVPSLIQSDGRAEKSENGGQYVVVGRRCRVSSHHRRLLLGIIEQCVYGEWRRERVWWWWVEIEGNERTKERQQASSLPS